MVVDVIGEPLSKDLPSMMLVLLENTGIMPISTIVYPLQMDYCSPATVFNSVAWAGLGTFHGRWADGYLT